MGPRKFLAERLTTFLLRHGSLDERVRRLRAERCLGLPGSAAVPLWQLPKLAVGARHVHQTQPSVHHSAILLVASFFVARRIKGEHERKRRSRPYASHRSSRFSGRVDGVTLSLAKLSLCAATPLVLFATFHGDNALANALRRAYFMDRVSGVLEEVQTLQHMLALSLWSILISVALMAAPSVWGFLDPRNDGGMPTLSSWRKLNTRNNATTVASVGVILLLAYADLPLFRKLITCEIQIDFGMPPGLAQCIKQALSSFFGFCIFYKFLPKESSAEPGTGVRKKKKHLIDPEMAKRMSLLAREARERVQARKNGGSRQLRRTYSEGNFRASLTSTPARRHSGMQSSLSSLPEVPHLEGVSTPNVPPSPLLDINSAGPTLSSKDLMAKLKSSERIKRIPLPPLIDCKLPEEGKGLDDSTRTPSPTTPTPSPPFDDFPESLPQSSTALLEMDCLTKKVGDRLEAIMSEVEAIGVAAPRLPADEQVASISVEKDPNEKGNSEKSESGDQDENDNPERGMHPRAKRQKNTRRNNTKKKKRYRKK